MMYDVNQLSTDIKSILCVFGEDCETGHISRIYEKGPVLIWKSHGVVVSNVEAGPLIANSALGIYIMLTAMEAEEVLSSQE